MRSTSLKSRRTSDHVHQDRWLVSYADFITLLFAFFVVLYASSRADERKQTQIAHSIQSAFQAMGIFPSTTRVEDHPASSANPPAQIPPVNVVLGDDLAASPAVHQDLQRLQAQLTGMLSSQVAAHIVALKLGRDGLVISLRENGFYDSGSALPHPSTKATLDEVAAKIATTPYDIRIEGHTDNVPIHTAQFASNWELSTARATEMAKIFIVDYHFAPARISAAGFAEYHPVAGNDTPEGRSQNRRVDIIVLPRVTLIPTQPSR
ncbi:MAG: flagellar motor protein MotB [Acidobacteriaceae bacterium]